MNIKNYAWLMAISLLCLPLGGCWTIEEGEKTGQIVDVWKSGLVIKTWECKIIRGGLEDGSGTLGQVTQLTIEDADQLRKAKELMRKKSNVIVAWHHELFNFFRSDSGSRFIDSIHEVHPTNKNKKADHDHHFIP